MPLAKTWMSLLLLTCCFEASVRVSSWQERTLFVCTSGAKEPVVLSVKHGRNMEHVLNTVY